MTRRRGYEGHHFGCMYMPSLGVDHHYTTEQLCVQKDAGGDVEQRAKVAIAPRAYLCSCLIGLCRLHVVGTDGIDQPACISAFSITFKRRGGASIDLPDIE